MEEKINPDAWDILNLDERTALSLSLGHGKSTWESGEIMSKAHFKYLEIQKRSRKYLEIFTNHFEKYEGLFPEEVSPYLSFAFKEYLTLTIIERKHISKATRKMESHSYSMANKRNKLIIEQIDILKKLNTEESLDLYGLIMDFDRWNNFRILPVEIQEPSAFKRRNKARDAKHLRKILSLPKYSVFRIIDKYHYEGKYRKFYLVLISDHLITKYQVIPFKQNQAAIKELSSIGLFIFSDRAKADQFGELVSGYFISNVKNCKTGQKFWPEFRELSRQAYNYNELQNIHKSRTYLDQAFYDVETIRKRKKQVSKLDRVNDGKLFYPGKK